MWHFDSGFQAKIKHLIGYLAKHRQFPVHREGIFKAQTLAPAPSILLLAISQRNTFNKNMNTKLYQNPIL